MKNFLPLFLLFISQQLFAQNYTIQEGKRYVSILPTGIKSDQNDGTTNNIAIGSGAMTAPDLTNGNGNIAIGQLALGSNGYLKTLPTESSNNTAIGSNTLNINATGSNNVAFGNSVLQYNQTGNNNTALGYENVSQNASALDNITTLGYYGLRSSVGLGNTSMGAYTLAFNTTGHDNMGIGYLTFYGNISGNYNTGIGSQVNGFYNIGLGNNNTGIGYLTLYSTKGDNNTTTGSLALSFSGGITAHDNTANGYATLQLNQIGNFNTAIGSQALASCKTDGNTAFGQFTLQNLGAAGATGGADNTAFGFNTIGSNKTSASNTVVGQSAMGANLSGDNNTAVGQGSLYTNLINTGNGNVTIGFNAGFGETGANNLYIESIYNATTILIGGDFTARKVGINRTKATIAGQTQAFQVQGDASKSVAGGVWITSSDRRLKKNIMYLNSQEILEKMISLKAANYDWIDESKGKGIQFGFIAQELRKVFPTKVYDNKNGYLSASYGDFTPMLTEAIKALYEEQKRLKIEKDKLKKEILVLMANNNK